MTGEDTVASSLARSSGIWSRSGTRAVLAGVVGGAAVGALDGFVTGLASGSARGLVAILPVAGGGLVGVAGAVLVGAQLLLTTATCWLTRRWPPLARWRPTVLAAVVLAAPLMIHDGLALFAGAHARTIPGRRLWSALAIGAGLFGCALAAQVVSRFVPWLERARANRVLRVVGVLALGGVMAGLFGVNRLVLPRLYPWFHLTLSAIMLVLAVLAARIALAAPGAQDDGGGLSAGRRARAWRLPGFALAAAVLAAAIATPRLGRSQTLLFLAHERTQLVGRALALLPLRRGPRVPMVHREAGSLPTGALPEGPHRPKADVIIITIDALRADHVGAYGYARNTTPHIDALAKRGVRFERAYSQAPNTSFSSTTILTGKYYPTLARLRPPDGQDTLPLLLRRYGIKTAAFYPPAVFYVEPDKLKAYAASNFHFEYVKVGGYVDAPARVTEIADFFAADHPARAFLWVHFFEPHEPYVRWPAHDFGPADIDRYDSEIARVDAAVGQLLAYLALRRPGAIVIVSADHGEEFDEHGGRYHGTTLYEEQLRVPLIIAVPGVPPHVVQGPVELVDLAPTILGLLDIPVPVRMRGTDLGPWLAHPPAPSSRLTTAFAELGDQRMVATAVDKLICTDKEGFCAYYDLQIDPREQKNLADARPDRVAQLRGDLDDWLADNTVLEAARDDRGGAAVVPPAIERGRLGDPGAASDLAALLASMEPVDVRREAARLLVVALPARPETRAAVIGARRSEDPEIAAWATVAAARLGDAEARVQLSADLAQPGASGDSDRRTFAALALAEARDPQAVPILAAALADCHDIGVCRQIVLALGRARDRRGAAALVARLPVVIGRRDVVEALGQIADPNSAEALVERLLEDEYVPVRAQAALALAAIGGAKAQVGLDHAAKREREPAVKAAIEKARRQD
jgi:HEAT repeat protein